MIDIRIDDESHVPKYRQIIAAITEAITDGELQKGDQLPSIQYLCKSQQLAPGTVTKAYEGLKERGIVASIPGKGLYVKSENIRSERNVLIVFDELNAYKEILYNSLKTHFGSSCRFTTFFHHHNAQLFQTIITDQHGHYSDYIIMPHFNEDVSAVIAGISQDKITLIDNRLAKVPQRYRSVYQDFKNDIYNGLAQGLDLLEKYGQLFLVLSSKSFQFVPHELVLGFKTFCQDYGKLYEVVEMFSEEMLKPKRAFIVFADHDLIRIIKHCRAKGLELGKDIGLISYDDTPIKEVLEGGITVISTDFELMGRTAVRLIKEKKMDQVENPAQLIRRRTF